MNHLGRSSSKSIARAAGFLAACGALIFAAPAADAHGHCRDYSGPFTSNTVPPPTCTSPVGLCTHGTLAGSFPSTYDFTFMTLVPAPTEAQPNRFEYTGVSRVTSDRGVLIGQDSGFILMSFTGPSHFETTVSVIDGTHRYRHVTGSFLAIGDLDLATGLATGSYTAQICHGNGHSHTDDELEP